MGHSGEKSACSALFVYGTLIEPDFRQRLLGRAVAATDARLPGFERGRALAFAGAVFFASAVGAAAATRPPVVQQSNYNYFYGN